MSTPETGPDIALRPSAPANGVPSNPFATSTQQNANHPSNVVDHGFNHLKIRVHRRNVPVPTYPPNPVFTTTTDERKYIRLVHAKLAAAKDFIDKEMALGLDPNRHMDKDKTAVLLAGPPITITFRGQELIRDLVKLRGQILELALDEEANEGEIQARAHDYLRAWEELRSIMWILLPSEVRESDQVEKIMESVLGDNLVVGWES
jgi:hypothetical protein